MTKKSREQMAWDAEEADRSMITATRQDVNEFVQKMHNAYAMGLSAFAQAAIYLAIMYVALCAFGGRW